MASRRRRVVGHRPRSPRGRPPRRAGAWLACRSSRRVRLGPACTIARMTVPTQPAASTPRSPAAEHPAPLAYFWGDDAYGLEAAIEAFRTDPARFPGGIPDRWRLQVDAG